MDKSMSKEDAILWIKNIINDIGSPKHSDLWGYEETLYEIQKLLKEDSAQQWIPCSERLPEPWTSVLVTYIYNGKRFVEESQYTGQDDERGNPLFSSYADEYKVSNAYFQKIAWMPLPEPYREETES